jgi:hypothetical protein
MNDGLKIRLELERTNSRALLGLLALLIPTATPSALAAGVNLDLKPVAIRLQVGAQSYEFSKPGDTWAFDGVVVNGVKTAIPLSRGDGFFVGGG